MKNITNIIYIILTTVLFLFSSSESFGQDHSKDSCKCADIFDLRGNKIDSNKVRINKNPKNPDSIEMWNVYKILLPCEVKVCGVKILDDQNRLIFREKINIDSLASKGVFPFMIDGVFSYYNDTFFPRITIPGVNDQ